MKSETVALLRSPYTHEALQLVSLSGLPTLVGVDSGERFAIRDGVAELLSADEVTGLNLRYQRFYDTVAGLYDPALRLGARLLGGRERGFRMEYLKEVQVRPGERLLEVSVGTGANLRLLPPGLQLVGLDISRGMLARCRRNLRRWGLEADLVLGDAEELPFQDGCFDAVLHVGGINAFNDRERALAEMFRVARPGARIVVVDESSRLMDKLSWLPGARRLETRYAERFEPPVGLVPSGAAEVEAHPVMRGGLYCLTFRRPALALVAGDEHRASLRA